MLNTVCVKFYTMFYFPSGGLAEEVDDKVLHAAFLPFGDIVDVQIPLDYETGMHRLLIVLCL